MAYATTSDLANHGIVASALSTVSSDVQEAALEAASERVDGFLRSRFQLPLSDWGNDIVEATVVIATWMLMNRRGFMPSAGADVLIRERYLDTMSWLNRVGRQEVTPNVTPNTIAVPELAAPRILTHDMRGW
jgi:phage gp36-like protein